MTPEVATNAPSYDIPEGRIRRTTTERPSSHSNGESVMDAASRLLHHDMPEVYSMDEVYTEFAARFRHLARTNASLYVGTEKNNLYSFDALPDLDALAEGQGISPKTDIRNLATDDWPQGESVEDFIDTAMEGRHEEEGESDS